MNLVEGLLSDWQRLTCGHHWVRARWQDGTYGLRCSHCMKRYRHTWNEIIASPTPAPDSTHVRAVDQPIPLRRAA